MKINEVQTNNNTNNVQNKDLSKTGQIRGKNFGSTLKSLEGESVERKLKILLDKIHEQGAKLSQRLDIKDLKEYKNLVSEFLTQAVSNSFKFSKESYLDRRGRHRVHVVVKKVNEKLDEVTRQVLAEEKDKLQITANIEDIRGMLIDLFM
jgi:uncharacterized protein YaaR (DUF327 family)